MKEIKIPDGCKASIDFEKRVVVIEGEKPNFKRGDIIFASDHNKYNELIFIYKKYELDDMGLNGYNYFVQFNVIHEELYFDNNLSSNWKEIRLATPTEQQLLFDALAKEGKKWNANALQIEDIEKDILVPESIGIFQSRVDYRVYGDTLYIAFNNSTQLLNYNSKLNTWGVSPLHSIYEKVQCKLTPCKRKDLKPGDTAFISETFRLDDSMLLDRGRYVKIIGDKVIKINKKGEPIYDNVFHNHWYKVEPVNK